MTEELNHTQRLELRDETGRLLGVFTANEVVEGLIAERDKLREEVARLHAELVDLQKALAAARKEAQENAALAAKKAEYLEAAYGVVSEYVNLDAKDLAEMEANGLSLEALIREIEDEMQPS